MITSKAMLLLLAVHRLGGGAIEEKDLLLQSGLSHGSLSAARKELAEGKYISLGKEGRRAAYTVTEKGLEMLGEQPSAAADKGKLSQASTVSSALPPCGKAARPHGGELATFKVAAMPRVTGEFADRDDWEDNLTARIGGSVDVDEEDDGVYRVHSSDFDEDAVYYATEDEDGFHVS